MSYWEFKKCVYFFNSKVCEQNDQKIGRTKDEILLFEPTVNVL